MDVARQDYVMMRFVQTTLLLTNMIMEKGENIAAHIYMKKAPEVYSDRFSTTAAILHFPS